jgi:hypothetical protein
MAAFPAIAFERPATEERLKAIGPTNALPPALQRALATEDFAPLQGRTNGFSPHLLDRECDSNHKRLRRNSCC